MEIEAYKDNGFSFIVGDDMELLSEKIKYIGGVFGENKVGQKGYIIPENKYNISKYICLTGDLPKSPKVEIKLEIVKDTYESFVYGKPKELEKYSKELRIMGGDYRKDYRRKNAFIFNNDDIHKVLNFICTGKIIKDYDFEVYDSKKTLKNIQDLSVFLREENIDKNKCKNLFISLPVVIENSFLEKSYRIINEKNGGKSLLKAVKIFGLFFNSEIMGKRKIFKIYKNNTELIKKYKEKLNVCKKYYEKQKKLTSFFLGLSLQPKKKNALYDFSDSGLFDRNLLPLISQYI